MPKPHMLFEVPGAKWERVEDNVYYCTVEVGDDWLCVWSYPEKNEYLCIKYKANKFTGADQELWLGPLEALCLIEDALKEATATKK